MSYLKRVAQYFQILLIVPVFTIVFSSCSSDVVIDVVEVELYSISFTWEDWAEKNTGANNYYVSYKKEDENWSNGVETNTTSYTLTKLSQDTDYTLQVKAIFDTTESIIYSKTVTTKEAELIMQEVVSEFDEPSTDEVETAQETTTADKEGDENDEEAEPKADQDLQETGEEELELSDDEDLDPLIGDQEETEQQGILTLSRELKGHTKGVIATSISPNGSQIATVSYDDKIILWNVSNGNELATFTGHTQGINKVLFAYDSKTLVSASYDDTIKVWDLETYALKYTLTTDYTLLSMTFLRKQGIIYSAHPDKKIRAWSLATGELLYTIDHIEEDVVYMSTSYNETFLAMVSNDTVVVQNIEKNTSLSSEQYATSISEIAFALESSALFVGNENGEIQTLDIFSMNTTDTRQAHYDSILGIAQSASGLIVTVNADNELKVWNKKWEILNTTRNQDALLLSVSAHDDLIATSYSDGNVKIWEYKSK